MLYALFMIQSQTHETTGARALWHFAACLVFDLQKIKPGRMAAKRYKRMLKNYTPDQPEIKNLCRKAGGFYLMMAIGCSIGMNFDRSIYDSGFADTMINEYSFHGSKLFFGFVANIVGFSGFLFLAATLHRLFEHVDRFWAATLVMFVITGTAVFVSGIPNLYAPVHLQSVNETTLAYNANELKTLQLFFLEQHKTSGFVCAVFWGLWMLPFGALSIKADFMPGWIGVLLVAGCFAYLSYSVTLLFYPQWQSAAAIAPWLATIGEVSAIVWFLYRGFK